MSSIRDRIGEFVKERIQRGVYQDGARLPSTAAIARQFGTTASNAHAALNALVKEGIIDRKRGRPSRVKLEWGTMDTAAICVLADSNFNISRFDQMLIAHCQEALARRRIGHRVLVHHDYRQQLEDVRRLRNFGRIAGAIFISLNPSELKLYQKLNCAWSTFMSSRMSNAVSTDILSFFMAAVSVLKRQRIKRLGCVFSFDRHLFSNRDYYPYEAFKAAAEKRGLVIREDWIRCYPGAAPAHWHQYDRYAYDCMVDYARLPPGDRPDGILVYSDDVVNGAILGLAAEKIKVPRQLKLVLHTTEEMRPVLPYRCTLLEYRVKDFAEALVRQLLRHFNDEKSSPILVGFREINHNPH